MAALREELIRKERERNIVRKSPADDKPTSA